MTIARYARPGAGRRPIRCAARATRRSPRSCASACATRSAPTWSPTSRSACCSRAASTRPRLTALAAGESGDRVSTFSIGFEESSFDELEPGAPRRRALRHRPSRAGPAARRGRPAAALVEAFDEPFADSSALPTYLVSQLAAGTSRSRSPARAATSSSAATTPTSPTCSRRASAGPRRSLRPLVERLPSSSREGELRLQGEALRRAARTCRRSSATTPGRRSSRPRRGPSCSAGDRDLRPARPLPRPLRRDRGRRGAGAAAGRRPRHLPRRRPAGEDRPRRAWRTRSRRASRSSTRSSPSSRWRCRRGRRCAASPRSGCCAGRSRRSLPREIVRGRKQGFSIPVAAWLRGDLEPFARDVLSPETLERQGCLDPRRSRAVLDEHVSRQGGPQPPALGAARLHALVRPLRARARHGGRRIAREARTRCPTRSTPSSPSSSRGAAVWTLVPADRVARAADRRRSTTRTSAACTRSRPRSSAASRSWSAVLVGGSIFLPWDQRDPRDPGRRDRDHRGRRRRRPRRPAGRRQAARPDRRRRSSRSPRA